ETRQEVARPGVAELVLGGREIDPERLDDRLMVREQGGQHGARVWTLAWTLLESRGLRELGERAGRPAAQLADALRDVVHEIVQLPVLRLEELVQIVELRANHVPVVVAGLGVQDVFVSQERGQELDDAVPVRVGQADSGLHRGDSFLFLWMRKLARSSQAPGQCIRARGATASR